MKRWTSLVMIVGASTGCVVGDANENDDLQGSPPDVGNTEDIGESGKPRRQLPSGRTPRRTLLGADTALHWNRQKTRLRALQAPPLFPNSTPTRG